MKKLLTSSSGVPLADNQNVMTAGKRGPMLLQDVWFLEKLAHFDRMGEAPKEIKVRHIGNCLKADKKYGKGVAKELNIEFSEVK